MVERLENQVDKEQRDVEILRAVLANAPMGIVKLAEETGQPEHKVRYSLRMLENDGLVEPTPEGAVPAEDIADQVESINSGLDDLIGRLEELKSLV
ncbi:winged helix-turn-helix transcriptional regulator [Halobacteriales archaeon Cl-PHB]